MITKMVEIRDHATCIPAVAIRMVASGSMSHSLIEHAFLRRCGYPIGINLPSVVLMRLADQRANSDPYDWDDRTHRTAHDWIIDHFDDIEDGAVVDVRVILGEAEAPADPEIWTE